MSRIQQILKDTVVPEEKKGYFPEHDKTDWHLIGFNQARQYTLDHLEEAERRIVEDIIAEVVNNTQPSNEQMKIVRTMRNLIIENNG